MSEMLKAAEEDIDILASSSRTTPTTDPTPREEFKGTFLLSYLSSSSETPHESLFDFTRKFVRPVSTHYDKTFRYLTISSNLRSSVAFYPFELSDDKIIACGTYAEIYRILNSSSEFIVKKMKRSSKTLKDIGIDYILLREEIISRILSETKNPHIILPFTSFFSKGLSYSILPSFDHDLDAMAPALPWIGDPHSPSIFSYAYQFIKGLDAIYSNKGIHRDLKPNNILILENHLAITDFGLSSIGTIKGKALTSYVQTRWFRAPELLLREYELEQYDFSSDVWSIGLILGYLANKSTIRGKNSIEQLTEIFRICGTPEGDDFDYFMNFKWFKELIKGKLFVDREGWKDRINLFFFFGRIIPVWYRELICSCLELNPSKRIKFPDIAAKFGILVTPFETFGDFELSKTDRSFPKETIDQFELLFIHYKISRKTQVATIQYFCNAYSIFKEISSTYLFIACFCISVKLYESKMVFDIRKFISEHGDRPERCTTDRSPLTRYSAAEISEMTAEIERVELEIINSNKVDLKHTLYDFAVHFIGKEDSSILSISKKVILHQTFTTSKRFKIVDLGRGIQDYFQSSVFPANEETFEYVKLAVSS